MATLNVTYNGNPRDIRLPADRRSPERWFNVTNFETAAARQLLGNQSRYLAAAAIQ